MQYVKPKIYPMKKLIYLIVIVIIGFSCQTTNITKIPRVENLSGIDFSKYSQKGFLITPEKYLGNYESIGLIDLILMPGGNLKSNYIPSNSFQNDGMTMLAGYWDIEKINVQDALEAIYNRCVDMGANALVNFYIAEEKKEYPLLKPPVTLYGYRVSGFAIKTK